MRYQQIKKSFVQRLSPLWFWLHSRIEPLPGQIANHAGGYYFPIDDNHQLDRFLILGSDSGTYYATPTELTLENTKTIQRLIEKDGVKVVDRIIEISSSGRAAKNKPALFALALATAADDIKTRNAALAAVTKVARTGSHILQFVNFVNGLRGWGRGLRKAISLWFLELPLEQLSLQVVKYSQRGGWSMRDLLRLAHPQSNDSERCTLLDWIAHPQKTEAIIAAREKFRLIDGKYKINEASDAVSAAQVIRQYSLPREVVPNKHLQDKDVWNALLVDMPMKAMIRNLAKMTAVGLLTPCSGASQYVANRLLDRAQLENALVHPIDLLLTLKIYTQGHGELGRLRWKPVPAIAEALNTAFYTVFQQQECSHKRILLGLDTSFSMRDSMCSGSPAPVLSCVEAAGATALLFARSEPNIDIIGFNTRVRKLAIKTHRLNDTLKSLRRVSWGGTDISLPIAYALKRKMEVDAFIILTDNETWDRDNQLTLLLNRYRQEINPNVKLVVLATAANDGDVCDPNDALSLGLAGFDSAALRLITQFIKN